MITTCSPEDREKTLGYLEYRFGIPRRLFDNFEFYAGPKGRVIIGPKDFDQRLEPDTAGLLIARIDKSVKPSSNVLQVYGDCATKNVVHLDRELASRYINGYDLDLTPEILNSAAQGYILLKYLNFTIGCGLLQGTHVKNVLAKAKRLDVKYL